jgi:hypothetical protein
VIFETPKRTIAMAKQISSSEHLNNTIDERYIELKKQFDNFMSAMASEDKERKLSTAKSALEAAKNLRACLATRDYPIWLNPFADAIESYINNNGYNSLGTAIIRSIGFYYKDFENHKWAFDATESLGFDFDNVFERYESESRIPELFDKIIGILTEIINCPDLDSRKIIISLEKIIATLKKNRNGSYFGVMGSWNFYSSYIRNFAWETLLEIPVLRVPVKALRDTMDEMNKEMEKVHENVKNELGNELQADFPVLEYHDIEIPAPFLLEDENVIDVDATVVSSPDKNP